MWNKFSPTDDVYIIAHGNSNPAATYTEAAQDGVRVVGAIWVAAGDYRVKLEGARLVGYQTMMLAVIRDPRYVEVVEHWADRLLLHCRGLIAASLDLQDDAFDIELRLIGVDSALGCLERDRGSPVEVGVMLLITANDQTVATEIAAVINPHLLHYPLTSIWPPSKMPRITGTAGIESLRSV